MQLLNRENPKMKQTTTTTDVDDDRIVRNQKVVAAAAADVWMDTTTHLDGSFIPKKLDVSA